MKKPQKPHTKLVKIPVDLKKKLDEIATDNRRTLQAQMVWILEKYVEGQEAKKEFA